MVWLKNIYIFLRCFTKIELVNNSTISFKYWWITFQKILLIHSAINNFFVKYLFIYLFIYFGCTRS